MAKWGVIVGKPRKDYWDAAKGAKPDMSNVGGWVGSDHKHPDLFDTREQARDLARDQRKHNKAWNFHVKKYE